MRNIHVKLVVMALLWSTSYPLGRLLSEYAAPEAIVMVRAFVAFLFLAGLAHARGELKLPVSPRLVGHFFLLGFFGFVGHGFLLFKGLEHTQANTAAVINGAIPIVVILLDFAIFGRQIKRLSIVGVGVSFWGTVIVVTGGDIFGLFSGTVGYGEIFCLLAIVGWAAYTVTARPLLENLPVVAVTAYSCLAGSLLLSGPMLWNWENAIGLLSTPSVLVLLIAQGLLTMALGFLWFYEGVREIGALKTSAYINLVPLFGVGLSLILLGEVPDLNLILAGIMVVGGLMMTNRVEQTH